MKKHTNNVIKGIIYFLFSAIPNIKWWYDIIQEKTRQMEINWIEIFTSIGTSVLLITIYSLYLGLKKQLHILEKMKEKDYPEIAKAINTNAETLQKIKEHYVLKVELPKDIRDKEYMNQFREALVNTIQNVDIKEMKELLTDMPIFYSEVNKKEDDNNRIA